MNKIERRTFAVNNLKIEIRGEGDDSNEKIVGHAAVFNKLSEDLGGFREKIAPGAFAKSLNGDVRALFNHNPDHVLGRTTAGTLRLSEDKTGLKIEVDPPDTQVARDLTVSIERGDISQMSFGFRVKKDEWKHGEGEEPDIRTLIEVDLFDVSPVTFPAYTQTDVTLRSMDEVLAHGLEVLKIEVQELDENKRTPLSVLERQQKNLEIK